MKQTKRNFDCEVYATAKWYFTIEAKNKKEADEKAREYAMESQFKDMEIDEVIIE